MSVSYTHLYNRSYSENKGSSRYGNVGLDMSYQPDTLNLITLNGWLWLGRSRYKSLGMNAILDPEMNPLLEYGSRSIQKDVYKRQGLEAAG